MKRLWRWITYAAEETRIHLSIWARVLWHLPILKCPGCAGAGGHMSGGECSEWDECGHCWDGWRWLEGRGREWFVGRIHPLRWPWVLLDLKTGQRTFTGWLLCRLGRHRLFPADLDFPDSSARVCGRCWHLASDPESGREGTRG